MQLACQHFKIVILFIDYKTASLYIDNIESDCNLKCTKKHKLQKLIKL
jgi:hypothetical protein